MFESAKDNLLSALDMIKQTYLSLMMTTAVQNEEANVLSAEQNEQRAFEEAEYAKLSTFAQFEEENKQLA